MYNYFLRISNHCMVFRSVGPIYYILKTGPTDPNITQGLKTTLVNPWSLGPVFNV